jgi:hypothetical protein
MVERTGRAHERVHFVQLDRARGAILRVRDPRDARLPASEAPRARNQRLDRRSESRPRRVHAHARTAADVRHRAAASQSLLSIISRILSMKFKVFEKFKLGIFSRTENFRELKIFENRNFRKIEEKTN